MFLIFRTDYIVCTVIFVFHLGYVLSSVLSFSSNLVSLLLSTTLCYVELLTKSNTGMN